MFFIYVLFGCGGGGGGGAGERRRGGQGFLGFGRALGGGGGGYVLGRKAYNAGLACPPSSALYALLPYWAALCPIMSRNVP